jgi:predicted metal-dependent HD superfamily phosphohydrolase
MSGLRAIFRGVSRERTPGLPATWSALARELPAIRLREIPEPPGGDLPSLPVPVGEWESQNFNFYEMDWRLDTLAGQGRGPFAVDVLGAPGELPRAAGEILTRCQRWMDRRNEASRDAIFDQVLIRHRDVHDLAKPLVRADYDHALDTWQWTLRLAPDADLAVQLAALFHDVERLASEADARVEHHAADYQAFKDDHAARGAELAAALLARAGIEAGARERAARLIAAHEHSPQPGDPDAAALSLLNDADALSFFSLNSAGYLDYFGPEATRRKVAYTLRRLRPEARRYLDGLRLRPAVADQLEALAA